MPRAWAQVATTVPTLRRSAMRRSSAAQLGHRHPGGREALGGEDVGEQLLGREHRRPGLQHADHARTLHSCCTCRQPVTPRSPPGRCWPRCSSAPTRPGCRPRCSSAPPRCSASPRAAPAPRCPAWWRPARRVAEDGGYRLVGRLVARQAAPDGQPPGRGAAVGRHVGAGHGRGRRAPTRRRPRRAARGAAGAAAGRAPRGRVGPARQPRRRRARPTPPRWSTSWCVTLAGRPPGPDARCRRSCGTSPAGRPTAADLRDDDAAPARRASRRGDTDRAGRRLRHLRRRAAPPAGRPAAPGTSCSRATGPAPRCAPSTTPTTRAYRASPARLVPRPDRPDAFWGDLSRRVRDRSPENGSG